MITDEKAKKIVLEIDEAKEIIQEIRTDLEKEAKSKRKKEAKEAKVKTEIEEEKKKRKKKKKRKRKQRGNFHRTPLSKNTPIITKKYISKYCVPIKTTKLFKPYIAKSDAF